MRARDSLINFLLISAGFAAALLVYNSFFAGGLSASEMLLTSGASVLAFWAATELRNDANLESATWWVAFIERFSLGTGVNLLLHAVLTYAFLVRRTPFLVAAGGLLAAALVTIRLQFAAGREDSRKRFLLVGFDSVAGKIVGMLRGSLLGVVTNQPALLPAGAAHLGDLSALDELLRRHRPTNIVVSMRDWECAVPPSTLLDCRLAGMEVEESPAIYERVFHRVCCEGLRPVELLLSSALRGDSRTIAVQSVYTDLVGLFLLVVFAPAMLLVALAVRLFGGPGPVLEGTVCAGFQYIPFRLLRFRTTRLDGTGTVTGIGRILNRLHLTNFPQLLNVVRGDMALVGPRPVRAEFAAWMTDVMPFYSHRFSVKPGILGWARLHTRHDGGLPDECSQVEYDLFYVKEGCVWLDAEIILDSFLPSMSGRRGVAS